MDHPPSTRHPPCLASGVLFLANVQPRDDDSIWAINEHLKLISVITICKVNSPLSEGTKESMFLNCVYVGELDLMRCLGKQFNRCCNLVVKRI